MSGAVAYNLIENGQRDSISASSMSREEAIENHWEEIRESFTSTEEVDACSLATGNCYGLEAEIIAGHVDTVYFSNGGSLSFFTEIDELGNASESDENGNLWDFTVDINSSAVDSAVEEWA